MTPISIVTPTYNQAGYIEQTIDSILSQNYPDLEYIIIDGGSTDNTVEIIKKYEKHLKFWVSEKDKGQANAINKGLNYCTGEIFNWLNSDDYLEAGALQNIARSFEETGADAVAGKVNNFTSKSSEIIANQNLTANGLMCWRRGVQFVQPGVWMRRQHFIDCGGINEKFHYAFDWDLLIRYLYRFPKVAYIDDVLVHFRIHDDSKTGSSLEKFAAEERTIIKTLLTDAAYVGLHDDAAYKTRRSDWVKFLQETIDNTELSRTGKMAKILSQLSAQPADWSVRRMTLGAIKNIFVSNQTH